MKVAMTPMEKIKAYHSIKSFLNEEQQNDVKNMLKLNTIDLEKRLWGKENEIEFILMIYLLEWCKNIVGFEEGIANLTNTVASDLYIELKSGEKIVVEIKSTDKKIYKISEKLFLKKKEFANKLNAKLYFALKLAGYWTLYPCEYIKKNNMKINLERDFSNSEFNKVFGDRTFLFPKGLKIRSTYSIQSSKHLGISNGDYGSLVEYTIEYLDKKILTINSSEHEKYFLTFIFENLQDTMSNNKQTIYKIDCDRTTIEEEFIQEFSMINLSSFMFINVKLIFLNSLQLRFLTFMQF